MTGRRRRDGLRAATTLGVAVVVIAAVMGLGAIVSPSGAVGPEWKLANPALPPAPARAALSAVACPTADVCLGVGALTFYGGIVAARSVIKVWSFVPAQTPTGNVPALADIACASVTTCFAVGQIGAPSDSHRALMERWDGTRFKIVTAPKPAGAKQAQLTGVSCHGPKFCMAVGTYGAKSKGFLDRFYSARWNGKSWAIAPIVEPARHATFSVTRVSCWSASGCFAVGKYSSFDGVLTFTERWNGTKWSIVPSPSPPKIAGTSNDNKLVDVSCPIAKFCFAIGYYLTSDSRGVYSKPYALTWNGSAWKLRTIGIPSGSNSAEALSVSCTSGTSCLTGGFHYNFTSGAGGSWVTRWNGAKWSTIAHPSYGGISDVACRAATKCVAVGRSSTPQFDDVFFAARFNGTSWKVEPPPAGGSQSYLADVSCPQTDFCFAVGQRANVGSRALVERWNGAQWSLVEPVLPAGAEQSVLRAVSCWNATGCLAVGDYQHGGLHEFAEQWDGTKWTLVAAPSTTVTSLSCLSGTFCMAAGADTLQWNGTTWTVSDPNGAAEVSCASPTSCMAVGSITGNSSMSARSWNGTTWSSTTTVTPPGTQPSLNSVSCPTGSMCTAVGDATSAQGVSDFTFIEQWNGSSWSLSTKPSVPNASGSYPGLSGVSCATTTSCTAAGKTGKQTLILQWDGVNWSIAASPNHPDGRSHTLSGVSCPSATSCFAVGSADTSLYRLPLILQYS